MAPESTTSDDASNDEGNDLVVPGADRAPSEVFDGPAHELNLGPGQTAYVNDLKKRELEDAFPDRYTFEEIKHHGTLQPIEGDHEVAWLVSDANQPAVGEDAGALDTASLDQHISGEPEEGLKDGLTEPPPIEKPDDDDDSK
jgi:hypothetical protein